MDRNRPHIACYRSAGGRSPQGEPWIEIDFPRTTERIFPGRSPQGEHGMFLFLTVQGGFVHADIRFNFEKCYSKKLSHKII